MRHAEHFYKMEWGEIKGPQEKGAVASHKDCCMWILLTGLHQKQWVDTQYIVFQHFYADGVQLTVDSFDQGNGWTETIMDWNEPVEQWHSWDPLSWIKGGRRPLYWREHVDLDVPYAEHVLRLNTLHIFLICKFRHICAGSEPIWFRLQMYWPLHTSP